MRVLVTGARGRVGRVVAVGLQQLGHSVRVHDVIDVPGFDDVYVSDLADFASMLAATRGVDAIVHLGGDPGGGTFVKEAASATKVESDGSWESILNANVVGAYNVFEAARQNSVKRVAYASRAGVLGDYPQDDPDTFRHHTLPTTPRVLAHLMLCDACLACVTGARAAS